MNKESIMRRVSLTHASGTIETPTKILENFSATNIKTVDGTVFGDVEGEDVGLLGRAIEDNNAGRPQDRQIALKV